METSYIFPIDTSANQTNYYWFENGFSREELNEVERLVANLEFVRGTTQDQDDFTEKECSYCDEKACSCDETEWDFRVRVGAIKQDSED